MRDARNARTVSAVLISLILLASRAFSQDQGLKSLKADFVQVTTSRKGSDTIKGTLFWQDSSRVVLRIAEPVVQWIVLEGNGMLLWYPNEKKAWRFTEEAVSISGYSALFSGIMLEDFGLAKAGFTISGSKIEGGSLITTWKPPKNLEAMIKTAKVENRDKKPYMLEIANPQKGFVNRVTYTDFVSFGSKFIPSTIQTMNQDGATVVNRLISYSNHEFNSAFPPEVRDFRLPDDVKVEDVKL